MERVVERAGQVRRGWSAGDVHDLRVALRRCRTMADALGEVHPTPGWRKLKRTSRDLFHALGALRDTQVQRVWVKKLGPAGDPVRLHMLRLLAREETAHRKSAEQALERFDRKQWKKLMRKLAAKARFVPPESIVFQRLALTRLNAATELYRQARRRKSIVAWHRLRIGLKRFRYVAENFLPQRHAAWAADLKRAQDLLGDVHDMDVLRGRIRREASKSDPVAVARWMAKIESERTARLEQFLAEAAGANSPWPVWRSGLSVSRALVPASLPKRQSA
jgi:CHAD domain-containing protein